MALRPYKYDVSTMCQPLIFLDIDGVLNRHEFGPMSTYTHIDYSMAEILTDFLMVTNANIVITSAWRYHVINGRMTLEGFQWLFRSHWIPGDRVIGITDADTMISSLFSEPMPKTNERGIQISKWIDDNFTPSRYVVIDDMDLGITDYGHPFVHVNGEVGLTISDSTKAARMLGFNISTGINPGGHKESKECLHALIENTSKKPNNREL